MIFLTINSYSALDFQFATLARMLQADPPPKAVKVTLSKRVPLVGEELIAYEEEQHRIKKEEAMKARIIKEEEAKASHASDLTDPMVVDSGNMHTTTDGISLTLKIVFVQVYFKLSFYFLL